MSWFRHLGYASICAPLPDLRVYSRRHRESCPAWGEPVNQEDMLGTVMGFSIVPLDGLRRLGIRVEPSLAEGYLRLWCVTGAMLGVREDHRARRGRSTWRARSKGYAATWS